MKNNYKLQQKLLKYSAMAGGILAIGNVSAQITYYDENPDLVVTDPQSFYPFDFDSDGNPDLGIITWDGTGSGSDSSTGGATWTSNSVYKGASGYAYSGAGIMVAPEQVIVDINGTTTGVMNATFAAKLNINDPIDSAGSFDSGPQVGIGFVISSNFNPALMGNTAFPQGIMTSNWASSWVGVTDRFIGFQFTSNGNLFYGWMRLDISTDGGTVTIKDWAYQSTPDQGTCCYCLGGVGDDVKNLAKIQFSNNLLNLEVLDGTHGNLQVVSMDGKQVYQNEILQNKYTIDLSNLSSGIYIVNAIFEEGAVQEKIVIK